MDARELMIGDYVCVPSELNRIKRIQSTFDLDEAVLYEPIMITPEILEKNGFDRYGSRIYILENDDFTIQIKTGKYVRVFSRMDCNAKFDTDFTVHKLQHAMRLCGIKKEIVL